MHTKSTLPALQRDQSNQYSQAGGSTPPKRQRDAEYIGAEMIRGLVENPTSELSQQPKSAVKPEHHSIMDTIRHALGLK